ncbi:MAG: FAD-dependent oxidoreductase [Bacteroidota bacterium]
MNQGFTYKASYWERTSFFQKADITIVGSGIVGLSAALSLKERQPGLRVVVVEKGPLPIGASTRNAGFACFGSMTELLEDLEGQPEAAVWELVERRWRGLRYLRERLGDEALRYREWGGYELFREEEEGAFRQCVDRMEHFNVQLAAITGVPEVFRVVDERVATFGLRQIQHLICNTAEGQIDTGRMMAGLLHLAKANNIPVWTGMPIEAIEVLPNEVRLETSYGFSLQSEQVLVATNGFSQELLPDLGLQPARNQVLITHPIEGLKIEGCFHYDRGYYYFRNIDGRILLGGGRHLAKAEETTTSFAQTERIQQKLVELLHTVIHPEAQVESWWSGILGVGPSKSPILKRVS